MALTRLLQLPDGFVSSVLYYQYLAVALIVELLIGGSFIAFELMGEKTTAVSKAKTNVKREEGKPEMFFERGLEAAPKALLPRDRLYGAYKEWCVRSQLQALAPETFVERFVWACEQRGVEWTDRKGEPHMVGMRVAE